MTFNELNIIEPILKALANEGYESPSPIQEQAIPAILAGNDLLATAQTGTGKTAAFAIPIIQQMAQNRTNEGKKVIKALILAPTRELASQINDNIKKYSKYLGLKSTVIFGGVSQGSQTRALSAGVDILVATPGRLLDLMNQRFVNLYHVEYFVLDEADRMLDMGFIQDVDKIVEKIPAKRQTLLFSATLPKSIINLAENILTNPVNVTVTPVTQTIDVIDQKLYIVRKQQKADLLTELLHGNEIETALVFSRTKHGANKIVTRLQEEGITAEAIHGNKSQSAREHALRRFKAKEIKVLVATDIAARGIDINKLSHVINYDLPDVPETYIHRIGRTGRAGEVGAAISFCSSEEMNLLKEIEKHIKMKINVADTPLLPNRDSSNKPSRKKESSKTTMDHSDKSFRTESSNRNNSNRGSSTKDKTFGTRSGRKSFDRDERKQTSEKPFSKSFGRKDEVKSFNRDERKQTSDKPYSKSFGTRSEMKSFDRDERKQTSEKPFSKSFGRRDEVKSFDRDERKQTSEKPFSKSFGRRDEVKSFNRDERKQTSDKPYNKYSENKSSFSNKKPQTRDYSNVRTYKSKSFSEYMTNDSELNQKSNDSFRDKKVNRSNKDSKFSNRSKSNY